MHADALDPTAGTQLGTIGSGRRTETIFSASHRGLTEPSPRTKLAMSPQEARFLADNQGGYWVETER